MRVQCLGMPVEISPLSAAATQILSGREMSEKELRAEDAARRL